MDIDGTKVLCQLVYLRIYGVLLWQTAINDDKRSVVKRNMVLNSGFKVQSSCRPGASAALSCKAYQPTSCSI